MNSFLTRVELHRGDLADYEILHLEMTKAKFHRTIAGDDGKIYTLPTAMYVSHGEITVLEVRELAQTAAAKTGRNYWVFTVAYSQAAWLLHEVAT